jgi:hypothetical protein
MGLSKILDRVADALVPKEIAPFLGPASMMFAGPIGGKLAFTLGQLGSAKMHSGRLDPYTALGTIASARAFNARNPGFTSLQDRLGGGITAAGKSFTGYGSNPIEAFRMGFSDPNAAAVTGIDPARAPANVKLGEEKFVRKSSPISQEKSFIEKGLDKGIEMFDETAGKFFPGFFDEEGFNFGKALTTIGSVSTLAALKPMAEELKRQKALDKKEEKELFTEWFNQYKRVSGEDYAQSNFPDPFLMEKYKEFMMAEGGRVGYNEGGGIMDVAPGIPPGMELDYRESGGFIPMGSQEKKDDVPAVLAKNEFVLTSDAMSGLDKMMGGSGDPRAAAKYMYQMMDQLEAMA